MQAVYQWQMTADDIVSIREQYMQDNNMHDDDADIDVDYFTELVNGTHAGIDEIDPLLEKYMDREILQVDPVERAILRLASYELLKRLDVPYRVVLNEAVSLAKKFCAEQSHTFINAVLDKAAREARAIEFASQGPA